MTIPPELWQRIRPVFDHLAALPPAERSAAMLQTFAGDPQARQALERLLAAADDPLTLSHGLPEYAVDLLASGDPEAAIGRRIGPYLLERLIGTGGMGAVYQARRDDGEFEQEVAAKLLGTATLTDEAMQRFRQERQILAWLNHPGIARLLDGGVADGEPYLVMELVDGVPIDTYCNQNELGLHARIRLFCEVCSAIAYAHANLVLHSDIKPGNILVNSEARIKVLDFGIAGLLNQAGLQESAGEGVLVDGSDSDNLAGLVMTRAYASPEQYCGSALSTASDVYALGVLLYELLTGQRPFDFSGLSRAQVLDRMRQLPPPPSSFRPALAGDIDAILRHALEPQPISRYRSPLELADDLQRFLQHQPVSARAATPAYRLTRFAQRHGAVLAVAAIALFAGGAGITTTVYENAKAQRQISNVRTLSNTVLFDLHETIRLLPGATEARRRLVTHVLLALDTLRQDLPREPRLMAELAAAYEQVAEVQGNPHRTNLGDLQGALASYREALKLRQVVWEQSPGDAAARAALGVVFGHLAVVTSWSGRNGEAIGLTQAGILMLRPVSDDRDATSVRLDLGRLETELGWWLIWNGEVEIGLAHVRNGLAHLEQQLIEAPSGPSSGIDLWRGYTYLADGLRFKKRQDQARAVLEERGLPHLLAMESTYPAHPDIQYELAVCHYLLGSIYENFDAADRTIAAYQQSRQVAAAMVKSDPANQRALEALAVATRSLGNAFWQQGRLDEAVSSLKKSIATTSALWQRNPENPELGNVLGNSYTHLCRTQLEGHQPRAALASCVAAEKALAEANRATDNNMVMRANLGSSYVYTARVYAALATAEQEYATAHLAAARGRYLLALPLIKALSTTDASPFIEVETIEHEVAALNSLAVSAQPW